MPSTGCFIARLALTFILISFTFDRLEGRARHHASSPATARQRQSTEPLSIEDRMEYAGIVVSKDLTRVMFREHSGVAYHSFAVEVDVRGALNISLFDAVEGSKADLAERRRIIAHENELLDASIIDRCGYLTHTDLSSEQGEARYMETNDYLDENLPRVPEGHLSQQRAGRRRKRFVHYVTSFVGSVLYTFAFPALLTIWNTVQQLQIFNIREELEEQWRRSELLLAAHNEWHDEMQNMVKGFNEATARLYMTAYRGIARAERKLQLQAIDRLLATGKIGHSLFPSGQVRETLKMLYPTERAFNATPYSTDINLFYDLARVLNGKYNAESGRLRLQIYTPSFERQSDSHPPPQIYDIYSIIHRGEITRDERKYVYFQLPTQVACNASICIPLDLERCDVLPATNLFDCPMMGNSDGGGEAEGDSAFGGRLSQNGMLLLPDQLASYPLKVVDTYKHFVYERKFKGHTVTATTLTVYKNTTVPNSGVLVTIEAGAWTKDSQGGGSSPIQVYQMHDPILFPALESDLFSRITSNPNSSSGQLRLIQERRRDNSVVFTFDKKLNAGGDKSSNSKGGEESFLARATNFLVMVIASAVVIFVLALALLLACCLCGCCGSCGLCTRLLNTWTDNVGKCLRAPFASVRRNKGSKVASDEEEEARAKRRSGSKEGRNALERAERGALKARSSHHRRRRRSGSQSSLNRLPASAIVQTSASHRVIRVGLVADDLKSRGGPFITFPLSATSNYATSTPTSTPTPPSLPTSTDTNSQSSEVHPTRPPGRGAGSAGYVNGGAKRWSMTMATQQEGQ